MGRKRIFSREIGLILIIFFFFQISTINGKISPSTHVKLTLENQPEIGGSAVFRLIVTDPVGSINANIRCFLPEGLEFINENNYNVIYKQADTYPREWEHVVTFYSGTMRANEKKEFIFKVRIPDDRKYHIIAGGGDNYDTLELDLGDPEPPEWKPQTQPTAGYRDGKQYIQSGIKRLETKGLTDLTILQEELPPLRTELRIRTKDKPSLTLEYSWNPKGPVPLRYLVYTENPSPQVEVTCILPSGGAIDDESNYKVSQDSEGKTKILLYSGPMQPKECKAFYFKVQPAVLNSGEYNIQTEVVMLTPEGEKLVKTDTQSIHFGRILY
jgi:hypothetical protein